VVNVLCIDRNPTKLSSGTNESKTVGPLPGPGCTNSCRNAAQCPENVSDSAIFSAPSHTTFFMLHYASLFIVIVYCAHCSLIIHAILCIVVFVLSDASTNLDRASNRSSDWPFTSQYTTLAVVRLVNNDRMTKLKMTA